MITKGNIDVADREERNIVVIYFRCVIKRINIRMKPTYRNIIHLPVDFDQRGASYPILMPYTHVPWYVAQCLIPLGLTCSPKWHVLMPDVSDASY